MPSFLAPRARAILIFPTFIFFLSPAYANDDALPPVIVTATRVPTPADEVASSVTLITSGEIEAKQERTLPEILQDVPGLNLVQTGGPGTTSAVFIRGTNAFHTKVLIDGIDVSDPSSVDGSFDFSQLLASDIDRVEVLRGPQSGLYGSDAIGGVINIITKTGKGPAQFTASAEAGSFATFNQTAGMSGSSDRFNYNFDVAHYHTGADPVTPSDLVPPGRSIHDNEYDNKTISTKLGANLTDNLDVGLVARYVTTDLLSTNDDLSGSESLLSDSDNHELFTRGTVHLTSFNGVLDQTVGLAYTDYRRRYLDPNTLPLEPNLYDGDRIKGDWQGNIKLAEGQTLTLGAEHQLDQIDDNTPVTAQMNNTAGFIQLQSAFGERFFNTLSLRDDDNNKFGSKATYRIAPAVLFPETDTKLKASFGTGYKAPTLDELFDNYPTLDFFANPNLKPETSVGYDAGFEQNLFKKSVQFGSTWFHNDIKNLIDYNEAGTSYANIDKATTYGFENFIIYKPWKILTLRVDYTFTIAEDDTLHEELIRRPKNKASLNATWQATDRLSLSGTVLYVGNSIDSNRDFTVLRMTETGYTTANIAAEYALTDTVSAFGRITNLLDRHYEYPIGFEEPGFGAFAGLKTKF